MTVGGSLQFPRRLLLLLVVVVVMMVVVVLHRRGSGNTSNGAVLIQSSCDLLSSLHTLRESEAYQYVLTTQISKLFLT